MLALDALILMNLLIRRGFVWSESVCVWRGEGKGGMGGVGGGVRVLLL